MTRIRHWSIRELLWPLVYRLWGDTIEELLVDRCPVEPYKEMR